MIRPFWPEDGELGLRHGKGQRAWLAGALALGQGRATDGGSNIER